MPAKVELYDSAYANYQLALYRQIRLETYGEDLGQTSWVTTEESHNIPKLLEVTAESFVLEIGCGSGRYALRLAEEIGCLVVGVDVNEHGIHNANQLAESKGMGPRVRFERCDVSKPLPFEDAAFDAVFSNDVLCHVPGRPAVLRELCRVLKPDGQLLFSDALVVGGMISHEEVATRSSIGYYVFSPPGENEKLLKGAGFRLVSATDTSDAAAGIAQRWREAREKRRADLIGTEGQDNFEGLQRFLACVHTVTSEKRLLRCVYLARKEA